MAISTFIVAVVAASAASNPVFLIYIYLVVSKSGNTIVALPVVVHATRDIPTIGSVTANPLADADVTDKDSEESSLTPLVPPVLSNVNVGFIYIAIFYLLCSSSSYKYPCF